MKRVFTIFCALAVLLSFAACSSMNDGSTSKKSDYKSAVTTYEKFMNGDIEQMKNIAPEEVWDLYEEETGNTVEDLIEEMEAEYQDAMEEWEEEYGEDIQITIQIDDAEECDEELVEKFADSLADEYDIDPDDVKTAYEVALIMKTEGSDNSEEYDWDALSIQIGNTWYLSTYYEYNEEYYVSFLIG